MNSNHEWYGYDDKPIDADLKAALHAIAVDVHFGNAPCNAALYQCTSCKHQAEMYTNQEWLGESFPFREYEIINEYGKQETLVFSCEGCGSTSNSSFSGLVAFRSDNPELNYPFGFCYAIYPDNRCRICIGKKKIHWIETVLFCYDCDESSMIFRKQIEGTYMKIYQEMVSKYIKDKYCPLFEIDNKGRKFIKICPTSF